MYVIIASERCLQVGLFPQALAIGEKAKIHRKIVVLIYVLKMNCKYSVLQLLLRWAVSVDHRCLSKWSRCSVSLLWRCYSVAPGKCSSLQCFVGCSAQCSLVCFVVFNLALVRSLCLLGCYFYTGTVFHYNQCTEMPEEWSSYNTVPFWKMLDFENSFRTSWVEKQLSDEAKCCFLSLCRRALGSSMLW